MHRSAPSCRITAGPVMAVATIAGWLLAGCGGSAATTSSPAAASTGSSGATAPGNRLAGSGSDYGGGTTQISPVSGGSTVPVTLVPNPLAFGTVAAGMTTTGGVTVTNNGTKNMYITGISFSGLNSSNGFQAVYTGSTCWADYNNYAAGSSQYYVAPGGTCKFAFSYTGMTAGTWQATFSFTTSYSTTAVTGTLTAST